MNTSDTHNQRMAKMTFASVYPGCDIPTTKLLALQ